MSPPPPDARGAAELPPPRGYLYRALKFVPREVKEDIPADELERIMTGWLDEMLVLRGLHHHPDAPTWQLEWHVVSSVEAMLDEAIAEEFGHSGGGVKEGDWRLRASTYVIEPDPLEAT